jgi:hypothetical protein
MKKLIIPILLLFSSCDNSEELQAVKERHTKDSLDAIVPLTPEQIKLQDSMAQINYEKAQKQEIIAQKEHKKKLLVLDNELVADFKKRWNNLKVEHGQFLTYLDSIEGIYTRMEQIISQNNDELPKLKKLCTSFKQSQKHLNALTDYQKFGQLKDNDDLFIPCRVYLKANANDPESIDIIDQQVQGRNKNGWIVAMRFRGKNAFGGLVINSASFVLDWVDVNKEYVVTNSSLNDY